MTLDADIIKSIKINKKKIIIIYKIYFKLNYLKNLPSKYTQLFLK